MMLGRNGVLFHPNNDEQTKEQLIWVISQLEIIVTNAVEFLVDNYDLSYSSACESIDISEEDYDKMVDNYKKLMKRFRESLTKEIK